MANVSKLGYIDLWLPGGSYIHNISGCINVMRLTGKIIPFPCYIPTELIYSLQADELCHRYYGTSRNFSIDIKNKTCEENRSSCTTVLSAITSLDCTINCANLSVNLTIERKVFKGIESSKMCNFHNISNCNSNKIVLIIYEPRDLCFSNDEEYGSNKDVCLFSAVCHYSIWVPLLACSGILLFFLTYAIISLVFIHRYLT